MPPHSIDSWSSIDSKLSLEFHHLKLIVVGPIAPALKEQLEPLCTLIQNKLAPESAKGKATKKPTQNSIASPAKKSLWDLIEVMLKSPSRNNCKEVLEYNPKAHWGDTRVVEHSELTNQWTPWMLFIVYSLDNEQAYKPEQRSLLIDTMNQLVDKLPEKAWTTALLMNEKVLDYPMQALLGIFEAIKNNTPENRSLIMKKSEQFTKLKQLIETALRHSYTHYRQVTSLEVSSGDFQVSTLDRSLLLEEFDDLSKIELRKLYLEQSGQKASEKDLISFFRKKPTAKEEVAASSQHAALPVNN